MYVQQTVFDPTGPSRKEVCEKIVMDIEIKYLVGNGHMQTFTFAHNATTIISGLLYRSKMNCPLCRPIAFQLNNVKRM